MKISSSFRDYYDYVGNQYGGGDPKIPYLRHKINCGNLNTVNAPKVSNLPDSTCSPTVIYEYKWLVVCGSYYLMLRPSSKHPLFEHKFWAPADWHILDKDMHADIYFYFVAKKRRFMETIDYTYEYYCGREDEALISLSKTIKAPVFCIAKCFHGGSVYIDELVPVLASTGIASHISAPQLYQRLAYFISNKMVESADLKVPVNVSDKDQIVAKGFDLKQSFRHRKTS